MMYIINGRSSRAPALMAEVWRLYGLLDSHGMHLSTRFIRSEENVVADSLSRLQIKDDWQLNRRSFITSTAGGGFFRQDLVRAHATTHADKYAPRFIIRHLGRQCVH